MCRHTVLAHRVFLPRAVPSSPLFPHRPPLPCGVQEEELAGELRTLVDEKARLFAEITELQVSSPPRTDPVPVAGGDEAAQQK